MGRHANRTTSVYSILTSYVSPPCVPAVVRRLCFREARRPGQRVGTAATPSSIEILILSKDGNCVELLDLFLTRFAVRLGQEMIVPATIPVTQILFLYNVRKCIQLAVSLRYGILWGSEKRENSPLYLSLGLLPR